jgi:hypothetical protein
MARDRTDRREEKRHLSTPAEKDRKFSSWDI